MKYKNRTKEQLINESAELRQRFGDLEAGEAAGRPADVVSNVYLVGRKRSIFVWDNNK